MLGTFLLLSLALEGRSQDTWRDVPIERDWESPAFDARFLESISFAWEDFSSNRMKTSCFITGLRVDEEAQFEVEFSYRPQFLERADRISYRRGSFDPECGPAVGYRFDETGSFILKYEMRDSPRP